MCASVSSRWGVWVGWRFLPFSQNNISLARGVHKKKHERKAVLLDLRKWKVKKRHKKKRRTRKKTLTKQIDRREVRAIRVALFFLLFLCLSPQ
jgi:hypothetical protein